MMLIRPFKFLMVRLTIFGVHLPHMHKWQEVFLLTIVQYIIRVGMIRYLLASYIDLFSFLKIRNKAGIK